MSSEIGTDCSAPFEVENNSSSLSSDIPCTQCTDKSDTCLFESVRPFLPTQHFCIEVYIGPGHKVKYDNQCLEKRQGLEKKVVQLEKDLNTVKQEATVKAEESDRLIKIEHLKVIQLKDENNSLKLEIKISADSLQQIKEFADTPSSGFQQTRSYDAGVSQEDQVVVQLKKREASLLHKEKQRYSDLLGKYESLDVEVDTELRTLQDTMEAVSVSLEKADGIRKYWSDKDMRPSTKPLAQGNGARGRENFAEELPLIQRLKKLNSNLLSVKELIHILRTELSDSKQEVGLELKATQSAKDMLQDDASCDTAIKETSTAELNQKLSEMDSELSMKSKELEKLKKDNMLLGNRLIDKSQENSSLACENKTLREEIERLRKFTNTAF